MKFAQLIELEKRLLDSSIRKEVSELDKLLSDDFVEYGASGRVYDKKTVIELLAEENSAVIEAVDFAPIQLSTDVVLLLFKAIMKNGDGSEETSLRSSIWKKSGKRWQLVFHQGTKASP